MLFEYIQGALENAEYKKLDDGTWFAEISGFEGVWANGKTVEECRKELEEVLEEGLILKFKTLGYSGPFSGGRHQFMINGQKKIRIPNPHGSGDIHVSLLKEILRQAG